MGLKVRKNLTEVNLFFSQAFPIEKEETLLWSMFLSPVLPRGLLPVLTCPGWQLWNATLNSLKGGPD